MEPSGAGGLLFVDFTLACCRGRGLGLGDDLMGEGDEWDPGEEGLAHAVVVLWVVVEQRQHCLSRQHWFEAVICGPAGIGKVALVHGNLVEETLSLEAPTCLADIGVDLSLIAVDKDLFLKLDISVQQGGPEDGVVGAHLMKGIEPETFTMYDWQNTLKCFNTHVTMIGEFALFLSLVAPRISATGNLNPKIRLKILPSSCIKFSMSVQRLTRRPLITIFLEMMYKFETYKKSKNAHPLTPLTTYTRWLAQLRLPFVLFLIKPMIGGTGGHHTRREDRRRQPKMKEERRNYSCF